MPIVPCFQNTVKHSAQRSACPGTIGSGKKQKMRTENRFCAHPAMYVLCLENSSGTYSSLYYAGHPYLYVLCMLLTWSTGGMSMAAIAATAVRPTVRMVHGLYV
jgi:hypothetical protein